jgi:hypothetical protein
MKTRISYCARYFVRQLDKHECIDNKPSNWQHVALRFKRRGRNLIELFDLKSGEVFETWTFARFLGFFDGIAGPNTEVHCLEYEIRQGQRVFSHIQYSRGVEYMPLR